MNYLFIPLSNETQWNIHTIYNKYNKLMLNNFILLLLWKCIRFSYSRGIISYPEQHFYFKWLFIPFSLFLSLFTIHNSQLRFYFGFLVCSFFFLSAISFQIPKRLIHSKTVCGVRDFVLYFCVGFGWFHVILLVLIQ